jgi:transcriptional regulator with XRE-family HTH domain
MDTTEWDVLIGRRLAQIRVRRGLSQSEVARRLGRPQSWVSKIESGDRRLLMREAVDFGDCYAVSLNLFDGQGTEEEFAARLADVETVAASR